MSGKPLRKVLLVQPPSFTNNERGDMNPNLPLGIAYIAATLEQHGYEVKMLDAFIEDWHHEERVSPEVLRVGMSFEDIEARIADFRPDVVGVTSMFTYQRQNAHRVAALAKKVDPSIRVVFGGAHPTSAPEMVLPDANVDAIVLGEGDNAIVPLLQALEAGTSLHELDGVGFLDGARQVVRPKTRQIQDLDTLPFPARHLLPMEKYFAAGVRHGGFSKRDRATSMITTRGCQYRCNFCTAFKVFTRTPRLRSVGNIMAEIDELVSRYGVNEIFFEDDQFLAKQRHTHQLLDAVIARRYDLVWDTPNGVSSWLLDEALIAKMAAAGCYRVNLAVESGNQWVLDHLINKPVKVDKIPELAALIRRHGMTVGTFLIVGHIGRDGVETLDQMRDSFRLARKIGVTTPHVSFLTPFPGSEVLEIAQQKGYLIPDFSWDNLVNRRQNLQTPEWTPDNLRTLVQQERIKLRLHDEARHPHRLLKRGLGKLRRDPRHFLARLGQEARDIAFAVARRSHASRPG